MSGYSRTTSDRHANNRIGEARGLPPVEARRRAYRGKGQPVAAFWPWALRPDGYYGGDVRLDHLQVAGLRSDRRSERHAAIAGIYEYFLYLLVTGRTARLEAAFGVRLPPMKSSLAHCLDRLCQN